MVKFDKVTKKFGSIVALQEVTFEVGSGGFVFITGPSGAGKSTIVKLLLKQIKPTSGSVTVDGVDLGRLSSGETIKYRRKIGVVFQDFKLIFDRTVFENVALPLEVMGRKEEEIEREVGEILELAGLDQRRNLFPAQLAGGEAQRVCLARAVVGKPKLLVADEPTGNLDPTTSWQIMKLLKKINKMGTTVLMATHNVDIVNSLKTRVIRLDKGKLVKNVEKGKYETS